MKEHPGRKSLLAARLVSKTVLLFLTAGTFLSSASAEDQPASARITRPPQDPTLQGRVEHRNSLEKLARPYNGQAGLNESVRILNGQSNLAGQAMEGLMSANSKEDVLNSTLDSSNFGLNTAARNTEYQKLKPHSDWESLSTASATMSSKRPCVNCPNTKMGMMVWRPTGYGGHGQWGYEYGSWILISMPGGRSGDDWRLQTDRLRADLVNPAPQRPLFPDNNWTVNQPQNSSLFAQAPMHNQNWTLPAVQPGPLRSKPFYVDQNVGWDAWYSSVSNALYKNWSKINSLPGEAKLRISIRSGREISAEILATDNFKAEFKDGLNKAVASLSGSSILDFPKASRKKSVTFDSVFTAGSKNSSGSFSERANDIERIRVKK